MNSRIELKVDFTGALIINWIGEANDRCPRAVLAPVFKELVEMKRYLRFNFSDLEHMSSSTLVVVMKFFKQLHNLGVGFDMRFDEREPWQHMTFSQLGELVTPPTQVAA